MGKAIITRILNKGGTPPHQYPHQYRDEHRDEYRVAVYCRVAAWGEGQENNYMNVSNYYKQNIRMQSGWKLVSIYADVGLTRVQTRPRFFDMLRDGQSGFFDILICESVRKLPLNHKHSCLCYWYACFYVGFRVAVFKL